MTAALTKYGAVYLGGRAYPGEIRVLRDRISARSEAASRTMGPIEQDYFFADISEWELTKPALARPRRTVKLTMTNGDVEYLWLPEAKDSFGTVDAKIRDFKAKHGGRAVVARPAREPVADRGVTTSLSPVFLLGVGLLAVGGLTLSGMASAPSYKTAGMVIVGFSLVLVLLMAALRRL